MNNSIIAVDILPENDGKVVIYGAPDKDVTHRVAGKLRIVLSKPLKTKQVLMKLKGKSEYSDWENQYSSVDLLKLESVLLEKQVLPRGVTDLDYEFRVPGNLPQTYVTSFGLTRYKLVASVTPNSLLVKDSTSEKGISLCRYYLPCRRDLLPAPPTRIYRGERRGILKYELDIPTIIGINEKGMLVRVRLLPLCDQGKVRKITFDLVQSEKYKVQPSPHDMNEFNIDSTQIIGNIQLNGSSSTKRKRSHPMKPTSLAISSDNDAWNNQLTYNLPFVQHNRHRHNNSGKSRLKATIKSPLMRVRHKLRIVMSFVSEHEKKLELSFPIIATTIPDEPDSPRESQCFDSGLPSYDDVVQGVDAALRNELGGSDSLPETPQDDVNSAQSSRSPSRNNSRSRSPTPTQLTAAESRSASPSSLRSGSPPESGVNGDYFSFTPASATSSPDVASSGSQFSSRKGKKLLLRPENNESPSRSNTTPSNSSSSTTPPNNTRTRTNTTPPALNIIPNTPTVRNSIHLNNNPAYAPGSRLFMRPGRASWYLNMPDDDDASTVTPEIHSAPSSPRESHHHYHYNLSSSPTSMNFADESHSDNQVLSDSEESSFAHPKSARRRPRHSTSFDPQMARATATTSSSLSNAAVKSPKFGEILRRASLTLLRRSKKSEAVTDGEDGDGYVNISIPSPTLGL